jgi:hypothetical protein
MPSGSKILAFRKSAKDQETIARIIASIRQPMPPYAYCVAPGKSGPVKSPFEHGLIGDAIDFAGQWIPALELKSTTYSGRP